MVSANKRVDYHAWTNYKKIYYKRAQDKFEQKVKNILFKINFVKGGRACKY